MRDDDDDFDREAILARRKRFLATALAGLALTSACASEPCLSIVAPEDVHDASDESVDRPDVTPQPCLGQALDAGMDVMPDVGPQPCLSPPIDVPPDNGPDAQPQPCLSPKPPDAGPADVPPSRDVPDAGSPMPCLSPPLDAGNPRADAGPQPCLSIALDAGQPDAEPQPCLRMVPPDGGP